MQGKEFDEQEIIREEIEATKDPYADKKDHDGDKTVFEITVVNKKNHAMAIDCIVEEGKISFNSMRVYPDDGIRRSQRNWIEKCQDQRREYIGPRF